MTLFPEMVDTVLSESIIGRGREAGVISVKLYNIRDHANNKHNKVDDTPYGGGMGMLMAAPPICECHDAVCADIPADSKKYTVYMSPKGKILDHKTALRLSEYDDLIILCGHYEGVDERFIEECVDEEISLGDFVMTGGEIPAMAIADSICRMAPGVLSEEACFTDESHWEGLLEYPQYTRPEVWHGRAVPPLLLSEHHVNIQKWRRTPMLMRTLHRRPELLKRAGLSPEDMLTIERELEKDETD
jgi:tRNA (guanine37-N1)-methyltransferase